MSYTPGLFVYDDLLGDVSHGINPASSLVYEAFRNTPYLAYFFRNDATADNDILNFRFQTTHRWNRGDLYLHLHYVPMMNPSSSPQYIHFDGYYVFAPIGGAIPDLASWSIIDTTDEVVTGDVYRHKIKSLATITSPGTSTLESSFLLVYLRRHGGDASDTYNTAKDHGTAAANVMVLGVDCHYVANKMGTYTEIPV